MVRTSRDYSRKSIRARMWGADFSVDRVRMALFAGIVAAAIALAAAAGFVVRWHLSRERDSGDLEAMVDREASKWVRRIGEAGIAIGIYKGGRSLAKGYGCVTTGAGRHPPDAETLFQIGSVSKLFTAGLLQVIADRGEIGIDAPLRELVGSEVELAPSCHGVTPRQLASHTSGFPSVPGTLMKEARGRMSTREFMVDPYAHLPPDRFWAYLATADGKRAPGRFAYSNYGMGLLGHLLERRTGRSLDSLAREEIFAPLGMVDTAVALGDADHGRLAQGHDRKGNDVPPWTFASFEGAGGFRSTVSDMLRFIRANIDDAGALSTSFRRMHAPQAGRAAGLGWMLASGYDRLLGNRELRWHNGMVGGYTAYVSIDPVSLAGVVIFSDRCVDVTMLGAHLSRIARIHSWASSPGPDAGAQASDHACLQGTQESRSGDVSASASALLEQ